MEIQSDLYQWYCLEFKGELICPSNLIAAHAGEKSITGLERIKGEPLTLRLFFGSKYMHDDFDPLFTYVKPIWKIGLKRHGIDFLDASSEFALSFLELLNQKFKYEDFAIYTSVLYRI